MGASKEYMEALNAYHKLYRRDKLKFIMNELDLLAKQDVDLDIVRNEISEFLKMATQSNLYKEIV